MKKNLTFKELMFRMIRDDLINCKMIHTFNKLGFQADDYTLYASQTILKLMGLSESPRWEEIHISYLEKTHKVEQIEILESRRLLNALAKEIYDFLKKKKAEERTR